MQSFKCNSEVLGQFLHHRRMILARALRAQRVRRNRRVWVYPRPQLWLEEMLNNRALNSLWKRHFRVSRGTFDYICGMVSLDIQHQNTRFWQTIPVQKRVPIVLWRLGSGNSYQSTAITFGIGKSSALQGDFKHGQFSNVGESIQQSKSIDWLLFLCWMFQEQRSLDMVF